MTDVEPPGVGERPRRYARLALERSWDPSSLDLDADQGAVMEMDRRAFTRLRGLLAQFGAAEQTVTEELAPLALVLDDPFEQRFVATQMADEARHATFFERYWETVVNAAERERGLTPTGPTDDRWTSDSYEELFDRTAGAMAGLVQRAEPVDLALAYTHYHLAVEGILADAAYRWIERHYGDEPTAAPELAGLVDGIREVRRDEGRHVAFGVTQLRELIERGGVDPALVDETLGELVALIRDIVDSMTRADSPARTTLLDRVESARARRAAEVGVPAG